MDEIHEQNTDLEDRPQKHPNVKPDLDCELCGQKPPHLCFAEEATIPMSPGPHFDHRQCRWMLEDGKCPKSLAGSCPECGEEAKGTRTEGGKYTHWKCSSCGWGDVSS